MVPACTSSSFGIIDESVGAIPKLPQRQSHHIGILRPPQITLSPMGTIQFNKTFCNSLGRAIGVSVVRFRRYHFVCDTERNQGLPGLP
jgi:hypothetical protein